MKKKLGLNLLATMGLAVALSGALSAQAQLITNGDFQNATPFFGWTVTPTVLLQGPPTYTSTPPFGQAWPAAEFRLGGELLSSGFTVGSSSKVIAISMRVSRTPGSSQAAVQLILSKPAPFPAPDRHITYIIHDNAKFGPVADNNVEGQGMKWRAYSFLVRINGGTHQLKIRDIRFTGQPANTGLIIDNVAVQIISN